jgi:acyl carrier protein
MQHGQNEVLECIRNTLAEVTVIDPARVVPEARWEDFGADQFDFFAVLRDLQKRYEIEISDDDSFEIFETKKVGDLVKLVEAAR